MGELGGGWRRGDGVWVVESVGLCRVCWFGGTWDVKNISKDLSWV